MTALMTVLGIAVFAVGLLVSIAWHEIGHLSWAKVFGIRVPQYMVGFGPTIWSRKRGETEYGVKAIPLGGYIRMIGMFPPGPDGRVAARSSSPWRSMIEDARDQSYEELGPGDEGRLFYTRKPWQRVIVMFAGPFHNLVLAFVLFLVALMGFGTITTLPVVSSVVQCVKPDTAKNVHAQTCPKGAPLSPAAAAGLRAGDRIVSYGGDRIRNYNQLSTDIRDSAGKHVTIVVERKGAELTLHTTPVTNTLPKRDANGNPTSGTVQAGYLGFDAATGVKHLGLGESLDQMGTLASSGLDSIAALPSKIPALWRSAFDGAPRTVDQPVGVIGVARVGGEVFSMHIPASMRIAEMLNLLAGLNLSLFLLNMLPLLPLDGGHIAGALWEAVRRNAARVLRRPDPGPFDVAKLMPVAYVVAGVFLCFTVLVMIADIVNPVQV